MLLWGGFLLTGLASLWCVPWGPGAPPLAPAGAAEAGGGCPQATQPWCASSRALTLPQFLLGYASVSVGYPLGVTLIQTIFSKVLGPRPQVRLRHRRRAFAASVAKKSSPESTLYFNADKQDVVTH